MALLMVAAPPAWANAGIPMLALAWPAQWLALLPVVGIETFVVARAMRTPFKAQLWPVAKANLLSTAIGVPIAWFAMLLIEGYVAAVVLAQLPPVHELPVWAQVVVFPFLAAWIVEGSVLEIQASFLVLAIPFCFLSVYIEHRSLAGGVREEDRGRLRWAVRVGNVLTYSLLCLVVVVLVAAVL